jgi:hypothetical protein
LVESLALLESWALVASGAFVQGSSKFAHDLAGLCRTGTCQDPAHQR